jgi:low affinity Fe/Cu permease
VWTAGTPREFRRFQEMLETIRRMLTRVGESAAHPAAFGVLFLYAVLWLALAPESLDWQGVATLGTWLMTLFIQRAGDRDTQALQAKLDELLRVHGKASNALSEIDQQEPEEIAKHRKDAGERLAT